MTTEIFIERAKKVHGGKYDYSETVFNGWKHKIRYYCPTHDKHVEQPPQAHLYGQGCPMCGIEKRRKPRITEEEKLLRENEKELKRKEELKEKKNAFREKILKKRNENPKLLRKVGDFSIERRKIAEQNYLSHVCEIYKGKLDLEKIQILGNKKDVKAYCDKHGWFVTTMSSFAHGIGCPQCSKTFHSKGEERIKEYLEKKGIKYKQQYTIEIQISKTNIKRAICDFFIEGKNMAIEYNGIQHYIPSEFFGGEKSFVKQTYRDNLLRKYCKEKGITLIEIPYTDYDNIESILENKIKLN